MGVILAKFRKQKTTYQILEKLEDDIKEAEALTISTKEKQRRFIVNLYLVSIGLLVLGCLLYYFYFLPPTWSKRILYSLPLFASSILIVGLGRLGSFFFQKRLNNNSTRLTKLREDKKKIIEKVMETETYKVALELLNRFGDKNNGLKSHSNTGGKKSLKPPANHTNNIENTPKPFPAISQIQSPVPSITNNRTQQQQRLNPSPQINILEKRNVPTTPVIMPKTPVATNPNRAYVSPYNTSASNYQPQYRAQIKTPFTIINQNEKKFLDKFLDFLIGDTQTSQYGMICKECYGHNGMVSLEDYEYSAFRCAFCKVLNPAKKIRPKAPALSIVNSGSTMKSSSSTSSSDKDSGSENEEQSKSPMTLELSTSTDVSQEQQQPSNSETSDEATTHDKIEHSKEEEIIDEGEKSAIDKKKD